MKVRSIKTRQVRLNDSLRDFLDESLPPLKDESILAITSKIISLCQGRVVAKNQIRKTDLVRQEADIVLNPDQNPYGLFVTIKNNILIPSAGIDESNSQDAYILYPENIQEVAKDVWAHLCAQHGLKSLGVIITDSRTTPLRWGVSGVSIGWHGFNPLYDYREKPDLHGRPLRFTQVNVVDALAAAAVFTMGEGDEQTPLAIIEDIARVHFFKVSPPFEELNRICVAPKDDIYPSLFIKT